LNGILVGTTPIELTDLHPGRYRVQLQCTDEPTSRVHGVNVSPSGSNLFIFSRFDEDVRSDPVLHLVYDDPPSSAKSSADARQFGRALPAPVVLIAARTEADALELRVVSTTQLETTVARVPMTSTGPSQAATSKAVASLLAGECKSFEGESPVRIDCVTGEADEPVAVAPSGKRSPARPPRGQYLSGVTLASIGTASMLTAYSLAIARRSAGDKWLSSPNDLDVQRTWLNLGNGVLITGATGAALLTAAMPLALPYERKTPWWAWLSGGVGFAAAAASIASAATAAPKSPRSCSVNGPDPSPCVARHRDTDRAFILGMTAVPLLTMPLVYLLRTDHKKLRAELSPRLVAGRNGGSVGIGGSF
jgi:hypothetical protein